MDNLSTSRTTPCWRTSKLRCCWKFLKRYRILVRNYRVCWLATYAIIKDFTTAKVYHVRLGCLVIDCGTISPCPSNMVEISELIFISPATDVNNFEQWMNTKPFKILNAESYLSWSKCGLMVSANTYSAQTAYGLDAKSGHTYSGTTVFGRLSNVPSSVAMPHSFQWRRACDAYQPAFNSTGPLKPGERLMGPQCRKSRVKRF